MPAKALSTFEIKQVGEGGYTLHIADDGGGEIELTATAEQLDVVSERLIELLEENDGEAGDEAAGEAA